MLSKALPHAYSHIARSEMHAFVPAEAMRILDVGCNTGAFGEALKAQRTIEVWGVEPNVEAAQKAASLLDRVIAEPFTDRAPIPEYYFDTVVFNDVLEHLVDPWQSLRLAAGKLRAHGCVVASLPNVRNVENLLHILLDRDFRYEAAGIRDRTHLRFFTKISMIRLFEESGFRVTQIQGINTHWWSPSLVRRAAYRLLKRQLEDTKYAQFAIVAQPRQKLPASPGTGLDRKLPL